MSNKKKFLLWNMEFESLAAKEMLRAEPRISGTFVASILLDAERISSSHAAREKIPMI